MDDLNNFDQEEDICRVCRLERIWEQPLFHPCTCTGSIKYIHEECLVQWMRYCRKECCDICNYQFSFILIYSADMPKLPIKDVTVGVTSMVLTTIKYLVHFILVALSWLCVLFTVCWIHHCLFNHYVDAMKSLPIDMWSIQNIFGVILYGCFIVICTFLAFIGILWISDEIVYVDTIMLERNELNNQQELNRLLPPIPEENLVEEIDRDDDNHQENGNQVDEDHWNPIDLDGQAVEDLVWKPFLGFNGYLVLLKYNFWITCINTLYILLFAYLPHQIGKWAINSMFLQDKVAALHFECSVLTLWGYCLIGVVLRIIHAFAAKTGFICTKFIIWLSYVVIKVFLLSVVKLVLLPLICGWWLDLCSMPMFNISFKDRLASFHLAPCTSLLIYWIVGMIYVQSFVLFCRLLKVVVRPGVLWFLWCL